MIEVRQKEKKIKQMESLEHKLESMPMVLPQGFDNVNDFGHREDLIPIPEELPR